MKAILEVIGGRCGGRKTWLRAGESVDVGRTERAEFVIAHDVQMSGLHFALTCQSDGCRLRDLGSTNGTFVNGKKISEAVVTGSDEIVAGTTRFAVRVQGDVRGNPAKSGPAATIPDFRPSGGREILNERSSGIGDPRRVERVSPAAPSQAFITSEKDMSAHHLYVQKQCFSGLTTCYGYGEDQDPVAVIERLTQAHPLYLAVDFHKLALPLPADLDRPDYLFDWLPQQAQIVTSPVLVSLDDVAEGYSLVKEGWGKDGLVCVYSQQSKPQLLDHLRSVVRFQAPDTNDPASDAALAFCWPRIISMMLAHGSTEFVEQIMAGIEAVLLEGDSPESWQLFRTKGLESTLDKWGFVCVDVTEDLR
jgi:pSer/pThr/pTyr-binding forkhead associated (FHA) protein